MDGDRFTLFAMTGRLKLAVQTTPKRVWRDHIKKREILSFISSQKDKISVTKNQKLNLMWIYSYTPE